jgi:hypothetical protein
MEKTKDELENCIIIQREQNNSREIKLRKGLAAVNGTHPTFNLGVGPSIQQQLHTDSMTEISGENQRRPSVL